MDNYVQVTIREAAAVEKDILLALLSEAGFEGFEEQGQVFSAFIPEQHYPPMLLEKLAARYGFIFTHTVIAPQNWNALWEAGFSPVQVDDFALIRAAFHAPVPGVQHDIVITPKMSFGTGHHATTFMMIQLMREVAFGGKKVFDFGTGTGILAILAAQLGALQVLAIDNDEWSLLNARENLEANQCRCIQLEKGENAGVAGIFGVVLANINKHILLENMYRLKERLAPGGRLLLSGLLEQDEADILTALLREGLQHDQTVRREQWIALLCTRN